MSELNFSKAKYQATLVLQCTSLAELYLKDYEYEMYKQGYESKQLAKQLVNNNARKAEQLRKQLSLLEGKLTKQTNNAQQDAFLEDVGFLHEMIFLLTDRCGDNEQKRIMARAMIFNMKSELNL